MDFTVIVVTHNRAELLRDTLAALSRISYPGSWEVLVVDNNSNDSTREIVRRAGRELPVRLRYMFVPTPGKYFALNAGIAATDARFIAATDDDAYPDPDWLVQAYEGFATFSCDFVGGPVYPVWAQSPPAWIDAKDALCGKVLGLQYHGEAACEYGACGWPLGVNVAYKREVFERVGLFDGRLGRVAGTLRNQSQREWHLRARSAGIRGMYLPHMVVHHSVEPERATRRYFQRWFYWHGVSRAILYDSTNLHLLEPESGHTHGGERHVLGVPGSLWWHLFRSLLSAAKRRLLARSDEALEYELMVCFCVGVIRQRLADRSRKGDRVGPQPLGGEKSGDRALAAPHNH